MAASIAMKHLYVVGARESEWMLEDDSASASRCSQAQRVLATTNSKKGPIPASARRSNKSASSDRPLLFRGRKKTTRAGHGSSYPSLLVWFLLCQLA